LPSRARSLARFGAWILALVALVGVYALLRTVIWPDGKVGRDASESVKIYLLGAGMLLAVGRWAWLRWLSTRETSAAAVVRNLLAFLMLALCFETTLNYGRYGTRLIAERIDVYDVIHYYLGPKYFDELGYFDLYPACILADREAGTHFRPDPPTYQAETAAGYEVRAYGDALLRGEEVKARFTPERWAQFAHDFTTLQRDFYGLERDYWYQLVNDHGFNGTPGWTGYAAPLVDLLPVERVKLICYVDIALLLGALGVAWWAFGGWPAAFVYLFLLTTYSTRWPTISWSILRYDYAAALIVATALVKKGRPLLAGLFAGHAAAMRLFPATWFLGPGVEGAWQLVRHRRISRFAVLFLVGAGLWIAALQAGFAVQFGADEVVTHWRGMHEHMEPENLSSRREGLAIALAYRGEVQEPWSFKRIDRVEQQEPVRKVVGLGMVLLLAWALRRAERAEAYAMGFIAFFALTTSSYYYYVVRAPLLLVHAAGLTRTRHLVALLWLLGIDLFCNLAQQHLGGNRIFVIGWLGWLLLIYCVGMIAVLWVESHRTPEPSAPEGA